MTPAFVLLAAVLATEQPSILVTDADVRGGVSTDAGALLVEAIQARMVASGRFSRVVTMQDARATLDKEQQRQLMDCGAESCFAELATSLKVDHLLLVSAGRVGSVHALTLRIFNTRTGTVEAAATRNMPGTSETALVRVAPEVLDELLGKASSIPPPEATQPRTVSAFTEAAPWRYTALTFVILQVLGAGLFALGALGLPVGMSLAPLNAGGLPLSVVSLAPLLLGMLALPAVLGAGVTTVVLVALYGRGRAGVVERVVNGAGILLAGGMAAAMGAVALLTALAAGISFTAIAATDIPIQDTNTIVAAQGPIVPRVAVAACMGGFCVMPMAVCVGGMAAGNLALSGASLGLGSIADVEEPPPPADAGKPAP